ncbi:hypothetical protein SAY87_010286 [Trapa incisa]|uniref:Small auxin up regulated protein n=1 Tax=Trapa incisa TaxID=236973 RepID=A0AAN7GLA7_9MYRT|nr:hypothetical protein SAY87_010286 [Trapa incisa]
MNIIRLLEKILHCICRARIFGRTRALKGRIPVQVGSSNGNDLHSFELVPDLLNHPIFESLLKRSGEEFGYSYEGPLRIACEIDLFRNLVRCLLECSGISNDRCV